MRRRLPPRPAALLHRAARGARAAASHLALAAGLLGAAAGVAPARAQEGAVPPERLAARERYQDMRFGMFIHWGVSSMLQDGEWIMNDRRLTVAEYETLAPLFDPVRFDARAWVAAAKAAGMRYITLITKHHDGFAMWDSQVSDWTITRRTPFKRDVVRELADECRRQGITLFFYYSQLDWHHPDYFPRGETGRSAGRPESGDFARYLRYMDAQLTELLTAYGPVGGIWFDGVWDRPDAPWEVARTYAMIHRLQPQALIIPNHHRPPADGEDAQTFEKDLPGANTAGFNTTTIGTLPLETSQTMNDSWGFRLHDRHWKPASALIRELAGAAGRGANYLLNVGPRPDGTFPDTAVATLRQVGAWLAVNGASIHGTRAGPVGPRPWGVTTQHGDTVYVHLLHGSDRVLALPALPRRVLRASLLADGAAVQVAQANDAVTLTLPHRDAEAPDQVVRLVLAPPGR
ncbi:MAG: alpha-L-fucosidase [Gemmatimonadaceae bacterium]|nr:alpha-L-fucosidase [Gemmatimonadaceae bacterium]